LDKQTILMINYDWLAILKSLRLLFVYKLKVLNMMVWGECS